MNKNQITGAIFDMDGTILDSSPMWIRMSPAVLRQFGREPKPTLQEDTRKLGMREFAPFLKQDYDLPQSVEEVDEAVRAFLSNYYLYNAELKPGALDFLKALKAEGIPLALATATGREFVEPAMALVGALDLFDVVLTNKDVGANKRHPDIFLTSAVRMNSPVETTWVFEDALYAIRTAKAAGFPICAVYNEAGSMEHAEIRPLADVWLDRFEDWKTVLPFA